MIDSIRATNPLAIPDIANTWLDVRFGRTRCFCRCQCFSGSGENSFGNDVVKYSPRFVEGLIARLKKDDAKARAAFTRPRGTGETG